MGPRIREDTEGELGAASALGAILEPAKAGEPTGAFRRCDYGSSLQFA